MPLEQDAQIGRTGRFFTSGSFYQSSKYLELSGSFFPRQELCFEQAWVWIYFWPFFFTNSSGHTAFEFEPEIYRFISVFPFPAWPDSEAV
jgi:hypothetical protein